MRNTPTIFDIFILLLYKAVMIYIVKLRALYDCKLSGCFPLLIQSRSNFYFVFLLRDLCIFDNEPIVLGDGVGS